MDCGIIFRHPVLVAMAEEEIERRKANLRTTKGKIRRRNTVMVIGLTVTSQKQKSDTHKFTYPPKNMIIKKQTSIEIDQTQNNINRNTKYCIQKAILVKQGTLYRKLPNAFLKDPGSDSEGLATCVRPVKKLPTR